MCVLRSLWLMISGKPSFFPSLTESLIPLCPRLFLNVSLLSLCLLVSLEKTTVNVRCLDLFTLLSLWVAIVFVRLLPFHWFLLWSLQLQLHIKKKKKKAFKLQLLWPCTMGEVDTVQKYTLHIHIIEKLSSFWINLFYSGILPTIQISGNRNVFVFVNKEDSCNSMSQISS